jgi:hypothetical protein
MTRAILIAVAFAALLLLLRFAGFLPALLFALVAGAAYVVYARLMRPVRSVSRAQPLEGISLHVEDTQKLRLTPPPPSHVEQLEIGATGPGELQFVLISSRRRATVKLSVEQARWLAGALNHWADRSETIALH